MTCGKGRKPTPSYYGTTGNDTILCGSGDDTGIGDTGNDTIYGYGGNDLLHGDDGADTLYGGDGNDHLVGGLSTDTSVDSLYGENGNDILLIGRGDNANGGSGFDTLKVFYQFSSSPITANFTSIWTGGTFTLMGGTISGMEALSVVYGSTGNDTITSGSIAGTAPKIFGWLGADVLTGGAGDDILCGFDDQYFNMGADISADTLYGLGGNDMLHGGVNDYIDGGSGIDTIALDFSTATTGANADFTLLLAGYTGSIFGTTLISIEHIFNINGTAYNDMFDASADSYATRLYGYSGDDTLITGSGDNRLDGGSGNDTMIGVAATTPIRSTASRTW